MTNQELVNRLNDALNYAKNSTADQPRDTLAEVEAQLEGLIADIMDEQVQH